MGPGKFVGGKLGPGKLGPGRLGPGKLGPGKLYLSNTTIYILGKVCQLILDKFCQQLYAVFVH